MNLRRSAAKVSEVWSHGHSADSPVMACAMSDLDDALSQPDMLAEAVEQLRFMTNASENYYTYGIMELSTLLEIIRESKDFISRYDEQKQERTNDV